MAGIIMTHAVLRPAPGNRREAVRGRYHPVRSDGRTTTEIKGLIVLRTVKAQNGLCWPVRNPGRIPTNNFGLAAFALSRETPLRLGQGLRQVLLVVPAFDKSTGQVINGRTRFQWMGPIFQPYARYFNHSEVWNYGK